MTMSELQALKAARERISTPDRWTKGAFARSRDGNEVHFTSSSASCWCAMGALGIEAPSCYAPSLSKSIPKDSGAFTLAQYNDRPATTHEDIMALFDRAIELSQANEDSTAPEFKVPVLVEEEEEGDPW